MVAGRLESLAGNGDADRIPQDDLGSLQPVVRVGVTGHRDVADPKGAGDVAAAALGRVLTILESARLPVGMFGSAAAGAATIGYRLVSPLAEGADRIVADLVLHQGAGLVGRKGELLVPLPFALASYRGRDGQPGTDCLTPESQAEFDQLADAAQWVRQLHSEVPRDKAQRDTWYRGVGEYVVEHCDVLFALWDGTDNGERGGTADIMRFALQRGTPMVWIPVARTGQPQAATPLVSGSGPWLLAGPAEGEEADLAVAVSVGVDLSAPLAQVMLLGRGGSRSPAQERLVERLGRMEELGRYVRDGKRAREEIAAETRAVAAALPDRQALARVADWIVPAYAITDALARRYQFRLKALNVGVYAAAAVAVALGALAAIMFPYGGAWRLLVIFEAAVLASLLAVQGLDLRRRCRDRWVGFRAMSEYFRIGRYLALVTPRSATGLEFQHFARLYSWSSEPSLIPWFAPVVDRVWDFRPDPCLGEEDVPWLRDYLADDWIKGQIKYHEDASLSHVRWDTFFRRTIRLTLFATVLLVILHELKDYFPSFLSSSPTGSHWVLVTLEFLAIALTSVVAALNGYAGQQRHNFHADRFHRMALELTRTEDKLRCAEDMNELRNNVVEVRRAALGETTNWFEGMQEQVMESPA